MSQQESRRWIYVHTEAWWLVEVGTDQSPFFTVQEWISYDQGKVQNLCGASQPLHDSIFETLLTNNLGTSILWAVKNTKAQGKIKNIFTAQ